MLSVRMILSCSGITFLLIVHCIVGEECNNCTSTQKPEGRSVITTSESNATKAVTIPPEPPNTEPKGRALGMALPPLDDVSMDDDLDMFNMTLVNNTCLPDQVVSKGCEETCTCMRGSLLCVPKVCPAPMHKVGTGKLDPLCIEKPGTDPCCAMLVCSQDTETEPFEGCTYKNVSYQRGESFNDACEAVCSCEGAGQVSCKPRCPSVTNTTSDRCVAVPDTKDPCCTVVLCDVSLDDHDVTKPGSEDSDNSTDIRLLSAIALNSTAVKLELSSRPNSTWTVENSVDEATWNPSDLHGFTVVGLEGGKSYHFRVKYGNSMTNTISVTLPQIKKTSTMCEYKGKNYTRGEEFHDGCMFYCQCTKSGVECANIECPTDFGLDVLDPHCLSWETQPPDFVPHPPTCCPETVTCKDNGSCVYLGERFPNWADIPTKLSGCEQRCYCEMGNVTCHAACPPVPATPPADLPCPPRQAILSHQHGDECCLLWMCPQISGNNSVDMKLETNQTTDHQTVNVTSNSSVPFLGPYNPDIAQTFTNKKMTKNQTHPKKDYFPGPFSPQHIDEENQKSHTKQKNDQKSKPHKETQLLEHILSPFYLDKKVENEIINETVSSDKNNSVIKAPKPTIPDSEYEDYPDTNDGIFQHFPISAVPPEKHEEKKQNFWLPQHPYHNSDSNFPGPFNPNLSKHQPTKTNESETIYQNQNVIPLGTPPGLSIPYDHLPFPPNDHRNILSSTPLTQPSLNPNQIYVVQDEQVQPQIKRPENNMYHVQHFQIPYNSENQQRFNENYKLTNNGGNKHVLPQDLYPHFQKLPQPSKTGQLPQHLPEEIFQIVHQHPQQVPINHPDQYLNPEELYLYHNQEKVPTGQPAQVPEHLYHKDNLKNHGNRNTIHIHSPTVPATPGLRVEEILAHLRHQETNHFNHQGQSFPLLPPHLKHPNGNGYRETLLTQHSSHPGILLGQKHSLNATSPGFSNPAFPGGFPSSPAHDPNEIKVHSLEAIDESTVRLVFSVPSVLVGLHGRVELRYTADKLNSDPSTWEQQVLAPPDDLIATPELEFELGSLQPDTTYKIKIAVQLRDLQNSPVSEILTVKTLPRATSTTAYPPEISVEPDLRVAELNSSWVKLEWRTFSEFELQFIDGVQLRYKEPDGKVFAATPLIHRAVTSYIIEDLKPDTQYQVGIFFIPFPGQTTELRAHDTLHITTAIENDPYKFDLVLDVHHIKTSSVELTWTGVPYPEDKYINIYRAIYQSDGGREDFSSFKVAKRDAPANTLIQGLKPATRYRLWLEAYLTNGRIKKSNVKDFTTKPGAVPAADTLQGQLEASPIVKASDYYVPLIGVSILAALAIVAVVILLLILHRKHGHNKAPITAANTRKPQSAAYDNPSYKVEIQQETMDL